MEYIEGYVDRSGRTVIRFPLKPSQLSNDGLSDGSSTEPTQKAPEKTVIDGIRYRILKLEDGDLTARDGVGNPFQIIRNKAIIYGTPYGTRGMQGFRGRR